MAVHIAVFLAAAFFIPQALLKVVGDDVRAFIREEVGRQLDERGVTIEGDRN